MNCVGDYWYSKIFYEVSLILTKDNKALVKNRMSTIFNNYFKVHEKRLIYENYFECQKTAQISSCYCI